MIEDSEMPSAVVGSPPRVITVTQLNEQVQSLLEETFPNVWVEGEISDPKTYPSGHTYFTLKDAESQISAVIFKGSSAGIKFALAHGLQVVARGRVSTYMKRGQYQLIVSMIQPKAQGALQLAFEQLKAKLSSEGLFDQARKRPIPSFPERIGIVTSLQGAAVRDMLSILGRRFDGLHIRIMPVAVQGASAAPQIVQAIQDFNRHFPDTDVLLVGRGGGSLEDLWAFNEESVARAIAGSEIPIISCVGHETDFTIADFVADLRAPTPSAAAELVVKNKKEIVERLSSLTGRLPTGLLHLIRRYSERLSYMSKSPWLLDPMRLFEEPARRIDELSMRLSEALKQVILHAGKDLRLHAEKLYAHRPSRLIEQASRRVAELAGRLPQAVDRVLRHAQKDLQLRIEKLEALSPLNVLERGYSIAFKLPDGRVIKTSDDVSKDEKVRIKVHQGEFVAVVQEKK